MRVLVLYGTTEGHTRNLCQFIKGVLDEQGVDGTLADAAGEPPDPGGFDACFVAASLHVGAYQAQVVDYARRHHAALTERPSAFLSVSLSAAGESPDDWEGLTECVQRFIHQTTWTPAAIHHVAGAIRYSRYDFFKRLALKFIAKRRGQDTVTSRDYDLTDYDDLRRFVIGFMEAHRNAPPGAVDSGSR